MAKFGLSQSVRRVEDPRLLTGVEIDQLDLHAVPLGPAAVHPLQHPRPIVALRPARAGVAVRDGRALITVTTRAGEAPLLSA